MAGRMVLYRGSLKSCNYKCSYCPFSKHPMSGRELEKDRGQWFSFVECYESRAQAMGIRALMVVPYGEALVHPWYWEGLARISALSGTDAVGAQTNLSFPIEKCLGDFTKAGGSIEKVRLWATFHPEMTSVAEFAQRCKTLAQTGVQLCAGSVGVPENLELLRQLRAKLPEEVYLWVNKMDGLGRSYTAKEKEEFLEIDSYFGRELALVPADVAKCQERLFVEGNGHLHTCNISPVLKGGWDERFPEAECRQKYCSCYLAYGGRSDFMNQILFGEYPLFRIPRRPKAVFLDIEGTLLVGSEAQEVQPETVAKRPGRPLHTKEMGVSLFVKAGLEALSREGTCLFFATTLPYEEAMKRCCEIRHLFVGGIFAGGAHLRLEAAVGARKSVVAASIQGQEQLQEVFYELGETLLPCLESLKGKYCFRILLYRNAGHLYKITLLRPAHRPWSRLEGEEVFLALATYGDGVRYYIEGNCMQIVASKADKASGIKRLCQWLGISPKDAVAVGDSKEDVEMMELCGI